MEGVWDALSAVGTLGAVIVSLVLARGQGKKEKEAKRSRARWVALELRQVLASWRGRVAFACDAGHVDLYFLLDDEEFRDPTVVPAELIALYDQLHELGDDAAPIADAIWVARQLARLPIRDALKGNFESQAATDAYISQFRAGMESLRRYLYEAEHKVSKITGLTAADPAQ